MAATRLEAQIFSSSKLNRSSLERKDADFLEHALPDAQVLLISGNTCNVESVGSGEESFALKWHSLEELEEMGFEHAHGTLLHKRGHVDGQLAVLPFLLGHESRKNDWMLGLDVSTLLTHLKGPVAAALDFREMRSLLALLPMEDVAVAGHAVALSQWHANNPFCSRCGAPNKPIEAGGKVQCTENERHKAYPRTDPVVGFLSLHKIGHIPGRAGEVEMGLHPLKTLSYDQAIMLVEDESGQAALLGRPKQLRKGVLTCLSGFIEQGESVEEAVRREVMEEAGVRVGDVSIVGSQPWPIGRGGSCELMVGCIAKATSGRVDVDRDEMDEARWVSKEDVRTAVEASGNSPHLGGEHTTAPGLNFYVPPSWAIAHHLIRTWAASDTPWFSKM